MTNEQKIDEAIAAMVYRSRMDEFSEGGCRPGDTIRDLDIRLGNEGPGSWTRFRELTVEERHIKLADELAVKVAQGRW